MFKRSLAILFLFALLPAPAALARDDEIPSVMILWAGPGSEGRTKPGILHVLQSYGFISEAEQATLDAGGDLDGESINIYFRAVERDVADANTLVERALDLGVDAMITLGEMVTQTAVSLTLDMDDPPAVIFTRTTNPYAAGIADAPCLKPDHVTGLQTVVPYEEIVPLLLLQDPDMTLIGTIHTSSDVGGTYGAERIAEIAAEMGLAVESAAVTAIADLRPAVQGLVSKGVEAIVLPADVLASNGIPIITQAAIENGLPFFYSTPGAVTYGATIGGGAFLYYEETAHAGLLLAAHLNDDIDIAATGIHQVSNMAVGVNLDSAELQGLEIDAELLEEAALVIEDGNVKLSGAGMQLMAQLAGGAAPLEDRQADDMALLESLHCTDEMIAEQKAALEAASE